jgi:Myb-like DNA-binding domain
LSALAFFNAQTTDSTTTTGIRFDVPCCCRRLLCLSSNASRHVPHFSFPFRSNHSRPLLLTATLLVKNFTLQQFGAAACKRNRPPASGEPPNVAVEILIILSTDSRRKQLHPLLPPKDRLKSASMEDITSAVPPSSVDDIDTGGNAPTDDTVDRLVNKTTDVALDDIDTDHVTGDAEQPTSKEKAENENSLPTPAAKGTSLHPPNVIRVETTPKATAPTSSGSLAYVGSSKGSFDARTPKHANTTQHPTILTATSADAADGKPPMGGSGAAFQPHRSPGGTSGASRHHHTPVPMQVSPGGAGSGARYFGDSSASVNRYPPSYDPRYAGPPQQYHNDFVGGYSRGPMYANHPGMYTGNIGGSYGPMRVGPQGEHGGYWGGPPPPAGSYQYQSRGGPPLHGSHDHHPLHGHPPYHPHYPQHAPKHRPFDGDNQMVGPDGNGSFSRADGNGNFSRAVSNSFDRSTKGDHNTPSGKPGSRMPATDASATTVPTGMDQGDDNGSVSDDGSWRQLNQVASVDEEIMRKRSTSQHKSAVEAAAAVLRVNRTTKRSNLHDDAADEELARHPSHHHPPGSNNSSLTNSPTDHNDQSSKKVEGVTSVTCSLPNQAKVHSSLESLSSAASAQEPLNANGKKSASTEGPANPRASPSAGSAQSLDLMKCASDSSNLLLPSHGRNLSQTSFGNTPVDSDLMDTNPKKRPPDNTDSVHNQHPSKKSRPEMVKLKKESPLSIDCSPPGSPQEDKKKATPSRSNTKMDHPECTYSTQAHSDGLYDKEPAYSYSLDSGVPSVGPPHLSTHFPPPRPDSSSSSTITPMEMGAGPTRRVRDGRDGDVVPRSGEEGHREGDFRSHSSNPPPVSQNLSWEINGQDSFAGGIMSNFSFTQDYPMLSQSASLDQGGGDGPIDHPPPYHHGHPAASLPPPHHPPMQSQHSRHDDSQARTPLQRPPHSHGYPHNKAPSSLESRNQSFDGGHYHGSFNRSDSMMSYEGRMHTQSFDARQGPGNGYQGSFPPHAPSWGSAGSYNGAPPVVHGYPGQYAHRPDGQYDNRMMRHSYSEDGSRATPPPGMRMLPPPAFQPPPEFMAPPSGMQNKVVAQNTIMTSPYVASKSGPFGWSKDEDAQLTEVLKKYKNPRDWEPIAKEHNRGRTAKECHERWIRYLKPGVRKGQWTDQEDAIVQEVVSASTEQPFTRWSDLAARLPGRVGKQIRDRWVNHLNPEIDHLPFSQEDDLLLWQGHQELGKRWVEISTTIFKSRRSENHIKNRWYSASFKKFIANRFPGAYDGRKGSDSPSSRKSADSSGGKKYQAQRPGGKGKRDPPPSPNGSLPPASPAKSHHMASV